MLVVAGDVLLDRTISGVVDRLDADAPVPVVSSPTVSVRPGGAGLAALLAARNGHETVLVTALAEDHEAEAALGALVSAGVTVVNLGSSAPTVVKTRIQSNGRTIVMIDGDNGRHLAGAINQAAVSGLRSANAVLVSDYGRGVAQTTQLRELVGRVAMDVPVVWDPHRCGARPVECMRLVTPNSREATIFAGPDLDSPPGSLQADIRKGRYLRQLWDAQNVVVTRGAGGAVLVDDQDTPCAVPAEERVPGEACGAGDLFAVVATTALESGATPSEAVGHAVKSATDLVRQINLGGELSERMAREDDHDAFGLADATRRVGGTVVVTAGCFESHLQPNHISLLQGARRLGDCLIVCLKSARGTGSTSNASTADIDDKVKFLNSVSCVDAVVAISHDGLSEALARIRPHIYVKNDEYGIGECDERHVVERFGGEMVAVNHLGGPLLSDLVGLATHFNGTFKATPWRGVS